MSVLIEEIRRGESPTLARLTIEQYHRMNEVGILPDGSPIELIDGVLVLKDRRDAGGDPMTHGPRHASVVQILRSILEPLVRSHGCHVRTQAPVTLPPNSEPEPDLAVVRGTLQDYLSRHPGPEDVLLVVEIAFSSLSRDRMIKARLYAGAGCPAYWIVNLGSRQVEAYHDPVVAESRYDRVEIFDRGAMIPLPLLDAGAVDVPIAEFLPE